MWEYDDVSTRNVDRLLGILLILVASFDLAIEEGKLCMD